MNPYVKHRMLLIHEQHYMELLNAGNKDASWEALELLRGKIAPMFNLPGVKGWDERLERRKRRGERRELSQQRIRRREEDAQHRVAHSLRRREGRFVHGVFQPRVGTEQEGGSPWGPWLGKTQPMRDTLWERILLLMPPEVLVPSRQTETLVEQALGVSDGQVPVPQRPGQTAHVVQELQLWQGAAAHQNCAEARRSRPMRSGTWRFLTTGSGSRPGARTDPWSYTTSCQRTRCACATHCASTSSRTATGKKRIFPMLTVQAMIRFFEFERTETGGVFAVVSGRFVRRVHRGQRRVRVERRDGRPARHVRGRPRASHHRGGVVPDGSRLVTPWLDKAAQAWTPDGVRGVGTAPG